MSQRYQNDSKNPRPGKLFIGERPYEPLFAPIRTTTADGLQTTQVAPSHTPDDGHNNERSNPSLPPFPRRGSAPYPSSCSPKPTTQHPVASRKTVASAERKGCPDKSQTPSRKRSPTRRTSPLRIGTADRRAGTASDFFLSVQTDRLLQSFEIRTNLFPCLSFIGKTQLHTVFG